MSERSLPRERRHQMNVGQNGSGRSNPDLQAGTGRAPPAGWCGLKPPHGPQFGCYDGNICVYGGFLHPAGFSTAAWMAAMLL